MRTSLVPAPSKRLDEEGFPTADEFAALRAWYAGLPARDAVTRYLRARKATGQSSRAMLTAVRKRLASFARSRHRDELVEVLLHPARERLARARGVLATIDSLRHLPRPVPVITDDVGRWLPVRASGALRRHGIKTLADLTLRIPRRRRWWSGIDGLGVEGAARIEAFFAEHPELTERARALVSVARSETTPWEQLALPAEVDGSRGKFRAPRATCALDANDDYRAVQAWLSLQDSAATRRAYRKEAERLILWAILERGKAMSSLTTEDAIAYREFLRRPGPRERWVGPARPRSSPEWRPFQGPLSARSVGYALSVVGALYRWLGEQGYLLANPFAGVKGTGAKRVSPLDASRGFTEHEWQLLRSVAEHIEWTGGWSEAAAWRLRLILDFWYATGLRPHEIVAARLGNLQRDAHGDDWLKVLGKGGKEGEVAVPRFALAALERHLMQPGLPVTRGRWEGATPLIGSLEEDGRGITPTRLWALLKRFFDLAAEHLGDASPATAEKLRRATPHWMRHTHATHALANGVDLTSVRDNLRHASVATTSVYLHVDKTKRARGLDSAFSVQPVSWTQDRAPKG